MCSGKMKIIIREAKLFMFRRPCIKIKILWYRERLVFCSLLMGFHESLRHIQVLLAHSQNHKRYVNINHDLLQYITYAYQAFKKSKIFKIPISFFGLLDLFYKHIEKVLLCLSFIKSMRKNVRNFCNKKKNGAGHFN